MLKKSRKTTALILLMMLLLSMAGCAGSQSEEAKDPAAPAQEAVTDAAKDQYFVSAAWLSENLDQVIILDARSDKDYAKGHIPGAINAPWQPFTKMEGQPGDKNWGTLLPKEELAAKIGALGIDGTKTVVVYTDPNGWGEDGRVFWTLAAAGMDNAKMLDGGWPAWQNAAGESSTDVPTVTPVEFKIGELDESLNVTTDYILENMDNLKIVDSRTAKEYNGATDFGEKRGGHLPNAINLPYQDSFNADGTVKSTEELKTLFADAGLKPDDNIVVYCTKGIRSAHMALLLQMAGFSNAKNFDSSYYEWAGNEQLPVEQE